MKMSTLIETLRSHWRCVLLIADDISLAGSLISVPDRKAVLWWGSCPAAKMTISYCLRCQSLSFFTEEIWGCPSCFLSLYIYENPLNHEVVDALMCSVSLEAKVSEELFVFLQISLSLKFSITSWVWADFLSVVVYIMYIVHTVAAAALCILVVGTEMFDVNQDTKVSQKAICAYLYIHFKYTHGCVCTIRYTLLG